MLGSSQALIDQVRAAAEATDEPAWQLPLETKRYRKLLDSDVADLKNVAGPYGGSITAAVFLSEFVGDIPWAHLDIAPVDEGRRRRVVALEGRHRLRHAPADRPGDELRGAELKSACCGPVRDPRRPQHVDLGGEGAGIRTAGRPDRRLDRRPPRTDGS